ncbi:MAG: hypothetical protein SFZ23_08675 [Planctomycetota bacterium]|nr:hypothetical protein [Planctomycetota bacterium]
MALADQQAARNVDNVLGTGRNGRGGPSIIGEPTARIEPAHREALKRAGVRPRLVSDDDIPTDFGDDAEDPHSSRDPFLQRRDDSDVQLDEVDPDPDTDDADGEQPDVLPDPLVMGAEVVGVNEQKLRNLVQKYGVRGAADYIADLVQAQQTPLPPPPDDDTPPPPQPRPAPAVPRPPQPAPPPQPDAIAQQLATLEQYAREDQALAPVAQVVRSMHEQLAAARQQLDEFGAVREQLQRSMQAQQRMQQMSIAQSLDAAIDAQVARLGLADVLGERGDVVANQSDQDRARQRIVQLAGSYVRQQAQAGRRISLEAAVERAIYAAHATRIVTAQTQRSRAAGRDDAIASLQRRGAGTPGDARGAAAAQRQRPATTMKEADARAIENVRRLLQNRS